MKHRWLIRLLLVAAMMLVGFNLATAADAPMVVKNPPLVENVEKNVGMAADPPAGAYFDIVPHGATGTVIARGFGKIYEDQIYVYGGEVIEAYTLTDGKATIPAHRWVNFPFLGKDGYWHYILVFDDQRFVPPGWMGEHTSVKPNTGKGSALTARDWLRPEYR